jgi:hypothetical protein
MDEIKLPHHVVDRVERRWKARFAQLLEGQSRLRRSASGNDDPLQSPQVRRLLEGSSLRPPKSDGTLDLCRA